MTVFNKALSFVKALPLFALTFLFQCSETDLLLTPASELKTTTTSGTTTLTTGDCGCAYTVPATAYKIDGQALGIKPGAVICLKAGYAYKSLVFTNLKGTALAPITIKNCGGTAVVTAPTNGIGFRVTSSQYLRVTGGNVSGLYGIKINGGLQSLHFDLFTSDVEADHIEILNSGFSGIMAKTDPSCTDSRTLRGNFVMRNVIIHDNYIHETAAEGMYVGHTFYYGQNLSCGLKLPTTLENVKIYNNIIKNAGREAIQVGSIPKGVDVYNNRIENYGVKNIAYQNNGVQFGGGAPGKFYGNYMKGGRGTAVMILENAENFFHDNVIINPGGNGVFVDERLATGAGFKFINNTIINPALDAFTLYSDKVPNLVYNNIVVNPGNYAKYSYPRTGNDAYVYLLNKTMKVTNLNNIFTRDINSVKFSSPSTFNYRLLSGSPAINKGTNIAIYNILLDHGLTPRLKGTAYDVGAYEY